MNEVLAVRSKLYIFSLCLTALFAVLCDIFLITYRDNFFLTMLLEGGILILPSIVILILLLLILAIGVGSAVNLVKYLRMPYELISVRDDKLYFAGSEIDILQIENVRYYYWGGRGYFRSEKTIGNIKITLKDGTSYKCHGIAAAERVHDRIFVLIRQCEGKEEN